MQLYELKKIVKKFQKTIDFVCPIGYNIDTIKERENVRKETKRMTLALTENQKKRVERDLAETKIKMVQALAKLGNTLEIAKTESGWEEWIEEDTKRVQYYENHIAKLIEILDKGEIEVNG